MLTIVSCKENRDYFRDLYNEFTGKKEGIYLQIIHKSFYTI